MLLLIFYTGGQYSLNIRKGNNRLHLSFKVLISQYELIISALNRFKAFAVPVFIVSL